MVKAESYFLISLYRISAYNLLCPDMGWILQGHDMDKTGTLHMKNEASDIDNMIYCLSDVSRCSQSLWHFVRKHPLATSNFICSLLFPSFHLDTYNDNRGAEASVGCLGQTHFP